MKSMIRGVQLSYEDTGNGPPVLLVHGFPLSRRMWRPQVEALAAGGFRAITPDLRGFGESDPPTDDWSLAMYADDLIALLDHLGVRQATICGMSMGGYILLDLLKRYPERCSAAAFIVTKSGADDEAGKERRLALAREATTHGARVVADVFAKILFAAGTAERVPELVKEAYGWMASTTAAGLSAGLLAMRGREDYTDLLPSIRIPSLVIGAECDQAIPSENSRLLAERLSAVIMCMIPGGGHMVNMEQPEAFNSCLLEFLRRMRAKAE